jgi:hypothetical protein
MFSGASRGLYFPNKKPAIVLTIAGFSEICCYSLENSTHDAKRRGAAMPNGQASFDQLRRLLRCKRVCHFLTLLMKPYFRVIVKEISISFL